MVEGVGRLGPVSAQLRGRPWGQGRDAVRKRHTRSTQQSSTHPNTWWLSSLLFGCGNATNDTYWALPDELLPPDLRPFALHIHAVHTRSTHTAIRSSRVSVACCELS
jgi:hypothetical protein